MSDSPASSPLRPPRRPPRPPLFPYTTLFRSVHGLLPRRPAERGSGMTQQPSILVVDDEMGILDVLRILLKGEGFDVTTAQGGKAGLEALKGNPPDIVLTDIKMPGVSGTEILAAVRDQDPETPVILMTAQASLQSAIQAVNQGALYYLKKPFSNDDLVAICRRAAEQRLLKEIGRAHV